MATKKAESTEIKVLPITTGLVSVILTGQSPLILNSMSSKAQRELLLPAGRKTAADRAQNLKHNPPAEFRASVYRMQDERAPTALAFPASAIKSALMTAAVDLPGVRKAQIGRLVWVRGHLVPLYGVPRLLMSVVRSADMNKTPDVRTRAIIDKWALRLDIEFVAPALNSTAIANLLAAGGLTCGIGDFRQEKGAGSFGQFRLADADDAEVAEIMAAGGRAAQEAALNNPEPYDEQSEELLSWFWSETDRRGLRAA